MICNKCNHKLPDDSKFCQYCGNKIETAAAVPAAEEKSEEPIVDNEPSIDKISSEEALKMLAGIQATATLETLSANIESQPNHEDEDDFGLVPEKPIYTLASSYIDGEEAYLKKLYTSDNQKIKWKRRGSISVAGIHGIVDIYDTYLPSGQLHKTIYINMYGAKESTRAPAGFSLYDTSKNTAYQSSQKPKALTKFTLKFMRISNIILASLSALIWLFIIGSFVPDDLVNLFNRTYVIEEFYTLWILFFALFVLPLLFSIKITPITQLIFLLLWVPVFLIGSYISNEYFILLHMNYIISLLKVPLNIYVEIFGCLALLVGLFLTVAVIYEVRHYTLHAWRSSLRYRERCYQRLEKIHDYYQRGIISEREFQRSKAEITKFLE